MKTYQFKGILLNDGWLENAYVTVDSTGTILTISQEAVGDCETFNCYALPGFQNAHSHAFQYAMAGLAEIHSVSQTPDDFWSWREAMYQLALSISPDDLQSIATQLYAEMLRHGYTDVAEFHYVHHDKEGNKYSNVSEMGERLVAAAKTAGIGITLVPIFYQKGGFGKAPTEGQKRFLSPGVDAYYELLNASEKSCKYYENSNVAIGIHSMRGVDPEDIAEVAKNGRKDVPFHIHISEQFKEIEDAVAYLNQRPVEWMLDHVELSDRFHLVHATHLTSAEAKGLGESTANVVLCPSTEGNLGDGIFPLKKFQESGGEWSIGTDSHVGLNPFEEFRILDYGQRLTSHKRNSFYSKNNGDGGLFGIEMALRSGRKAMGNYQHQFFAVGQKLDACLIDARYPLIAASAWDKLCSTIVYSSDVTAQYGTISKGKLMVKEGRHIQQDQIAQDFIETIAKLQNRS